MELRCEGDSRGTLLRVRFFGFACTSVAPAAVVFAAAAAAAAEFLRGFAIVVASCVQGWRRRRREVLGGQLWWHGEVAVLKMRGGKVMGRQRDWLAILESRAGAK
jgi:hypothetical protein